MVEGKDAAGEKSPYTLSSSDNPGACIISIQLNGDNYNEWASDMYNALQAKRKLGFINGTLKKPEGTGSDVEDWLTVNSMLIGWLRASIEPKIKSTVAYITDSHTLWNELKKRYSVGNTVRIHHIKAQLASCRQGGETVSEYFAKLSALWEELIAYQPIHPCSCGSAAALAKEREQEKIHQFVMGLDEVRFGSLCTQIIGTDPLPDLGDVYSKIVREEARIVSTRNREQHQEAVGFVARREGSDANLPGSVSSGSVSSKTESAARPEGSILRSRMLCSHCGRTGHEKRNCWQLHGYPDSYYERNNGGRGGSNSSRGRGGRSSSGRGSGRGLANAAHATSSNASSFPEFTPEQWRTLAQMLQEKSSSGNPDKLSGKIGLGDVILDTGASHHMTGNSSFLSHIQPISPCSIAFADGSKTLATSMGVFTLSDRITLHNVLFVPDLNCTLISVAKLLKQTHCFALFTDTICVLQDRFSRTMIGTGKERDGVYYLTALVSAKSHRVVGVSDEVLWHQRLGHPSFSVFSDLSFISSSSNKASTSPCDICFRAKQTRSVFPDSLNKTRECFELIHVDVWGPYRVPSSCGAVYFLTIVDDFSRAVWTYLLLEKSEVKSVLIKFLTYAEKQFSKSVKVVRSDNGTEFMCLAAFFRDHGILHQTSCVSTPQQNGRVERKHRHILNVSRALLFQASLPVKFWGEAVLTAAYLINRTPTAVLKGRSPYEVLYQTKPDYKVLKVFGSACYVHRMHRDKDKFGERSRLCVFVGYPFGKKGWKVYDVTTNEFFVSRDVVFREDLFPFAEQVSTPPASIAQPGSCDEDWLVTPIDRRGTADDIPAETSPEEMILVDTSPEETSPPLTEASSQVIETSPNTAAPVVETDEDDPVESSEDDLPPPEPELGRGKREKKPSVLLRGFVVTRNAVLDSSHHALTPTGSSPSKMVHGTSLYPLNDYVSDDKFSSRHRAFLAAITSSTEPKHFKEAVLVKEWNNAMTSEVVSLEDKHTWDITDLPPGKEAIGSQWVYKIKYNADGSVERYKARLVVQGNNQVEGEDYNETFAPVVKMTTVRTLLRLVAAHNWNVYQMDVNNAFLHGDLAEEVYMKLPPGFRHSHPGKVCRLRKSLYGLKQAPRCWFQKLSDSLLRFGFVQSYDDYSFFSFTRKNIEMRVLIYVDDLLICGNDEHMVRKFKEYLSRCFSMKDLGKLKYFLGIEVSRGPEGIFLSQRKYALDLIADSGYLGSKPAATPLESNHRLASTDSPVLADPTPYRRLVGRLIYLLNTRPELCYAVHLLSQFMKAPTQAQFDAALRVVRFLKGSPGQGILLKSTTDLSLTVYCDSDWASCPLTRRSLSSFVVMLGDSPIAWKTKKQDTVSHSSAEAEYRAMAAALREIKWIRGLLQEFGLPQTTPTTLFCDSKAAIHIAANPVFHERTKHIEADCHAVRDAAQDGIIVIKHVRTDDQVADILTKALGRVPFQKLMSKLGVVNLHTPT